MILKTVENTLRSNFQYDLLSCVLFFLLCSIFPPPKCFVCFILVCFVMETMNEAINAILKTPQNSAIILHFPIIWIHLFTKKMCWFCLAYYHRKCHNIMLCIYVGIMQQRHTDYYLCESFFFLGILSFHVHDSIRVPSH